mgnify:CR=1 FL=1
MKWLRTGVSMLVLYLGSIWLVFPTTWRRLVNQRIFVEFSCTLKKIQDEEGSLVENGSKFRLSPLSLRPCSEIIFFSLYVLLCSFPIVICQSKSRFDKGQPALLLHRLCVPRGAPLYLNLRPGCALSGRGCGFH